MFNAGKIQDGLTGLVAVRQPLDPTFDRLDANQYLSSSGLFLDDVQHFRFEYWVDAQNFVNATDSDLQTAWLNLEKSSIVNVMSQVFNRPTYIDRNLIYSNTFDRDELINLTDDTFYGFEIKVSDRKNLAFTITNVRIEGLTDVAGGVLTLYLYHSSQLDPIETKDITLSDDGTLHVERLDWVVDNSENYYKGTFFIGYYKPEFLFNPYAREFNTSSVMNEISDLCIRPIVRSGGFNSLEDIDTDSNHNGLNFDITVYEDYTDLVLQNKFIFSRAIQLQWATSVLLQIASSNRSNKNQRMSSEMIQVILLSINGQRGFGLPTIIGFRDMINGELDRLKDEIQSIIDGYFTGTISISTLC